MRIACIGECTNDFYLEQGQGYIGGISLNCAVHARRCGAQHVALVSCVGDDLPGQRARQRLVEEGIDISHLHTRPGRTPQQDIRLLPDGERVFPPGGYHLGVLQDFRLSADDLAFIRQHDVVDLALFTQVQPLFEQVLHDRGFTGRRAADLLDFGDYGRQYLRIADFMNALDLLFISGGEDTLAALAPLSRDFAGCLVVTMGVRGSAALVKGERYDQPALLASNPVAATGCGDAFRAAFSVCYFDGGEVRQALEHGARHAASVVQHFGAI